MEKMSVPLAHCGNHTFIGTTLIMNPIAKNMLAAIVGFVIGSVVNLGLVNFGMSVVPLPEGADVSTMEDVRESMKLFTPMNFMFPFLARVTLPLITVPVFG